MAGKHGRRVYLQILLEPYRAELLQNMSEEQEKRMTAVAREIIYQGLERAFPSSIYNEAKAKDAALWRESVRNRIEGRTKKRKESKDAA
jgi:hypothetical protein